MKISNLALINFLLLAGIGSTSAQEAAKWTASVEKSVVKIGEKFTLHIHATIEDGWHVYSTTPQQDGPVVTTIDFPTSSPLKRIGKIKQPKPIVKFDDAFGINTEYYEKEATFTLTAVVKEKAKIGKQKLIIEVNYMACNDRLCLPPKTVEVPLELTIEDGDEIATTTEAQAVPDDVAPSNTSEGNNTDTASAAKTKQGSIEDQSLGYGDERDVRKAKDEGFWAYIGLAMSVGALALLTPCVFPMIPITVSFFTKREAASRARSVRDAFIYSLGIVFTFTGLGIVLALTLGASGINQFAANPWMNILIAGIFIVFALNLFGLFEIVVPSSILTKLTVASGSGQGVVSILLMGLTFTLTSFTCTVPFVGTVMVAAASGDIWWSVLGMLAFSSVFAFPFFLLALFPSWLKSLPKSGGWLNSVKVVMGFLELAAAMKFVSNVDLIWSIGILSRDLFLSFWIGLGVMVTLYLMGIFQLPHDSKIERIGVFRMLFGVFFLSVSVFLYTGLKGTPLGELDAFLPPLQYQQTIQAANGSSSSSAPGAKNEEHWYADYQEALTVAQAESKPLFIDFTGFACTNCRWMEANVFPRPDVKERLDRYILVRLYTDGQGEMYDKNRAYQEKRFGTIALPLYVIMRNTDEIISTFPGLTRKPEEFVAFLDRGLKNPSVASIVN